eukprot:SAG11_NODE_139_length_15111_cov_9.482214_6_plen_267_part_00
MTDVDGQTQGLCCANPCVNPRQDLVADEDQQEEQHKGLEHHRTKYLDLWKIYMRTHQSELSDFLTELLWYIPALFLLVAMLNIMFPDQSVSLRQKEVITTLLLDDEIMGPSEDFAVNTFSVEGVEHIWQWADNVLLGNIYEEEADTEDPCGTPIPGGVAEPVSDLPLLVFDHNTMLGSVHIRQARSFKRAVCPPLATLLHHHWMGTVPVPEEAGPPTRPHLERHPNDIGQDVVTTTHPQPSFECYHEWASVGKPIYIVSWPSRHGC